MELSKDIKGRLILELYEKTGRVDNESIHNAEAGYQDYQIEYFDEWFKEKYKDKGIAYAVGQRVGRMFTVK